MPTPGNVDSGFTTIITIKQENVAAPFTNIVPLGTDVTESTGTPPTAAAEKLLGGMPTVSFPVDNDMQDLGELGMRGNPKDVGGLKLDGKMERHKRDSMLYGATLGCADYVAGSIKYTPTDTQLPSFKVYIYVNNKTAAGVPQRDAVPGATDKGDELTILEGVKFGNYDAPSEAMKRVKEGVSWSATKMTVYRNYTKGVL